MNRTLHAVADVPNQFGRKGGRGLRPWLLLPKMLAVGLYLGGLAAATLLRWARPEDVETTHLLFRRLILPALWLALIFGVLLLLQHPGTFLRLRWLQVKLIVLALLIPTAHFYLRQHVADERFAPAAAGFLVAFAVVACVGRLKPRLGQNIAKALSRGS